jgi:DNA-binding MarR family transcriptional regulator
LSTDNNDNSLVIIGAIVKQNKAYEIIWLIRRLFRAMAAFADEYLRDSGLTVADRAVMEFLYPDARLSVPEIASRYKVSRQHVQVTVNKLLESGLLHSEENPKHKRSLLIRLSSLGQDSFEQIRRNESVLLNRLFAGLGNEDLEVTSTTLRSLLEQLD